MNCSVFRGALMEDIDTRIKKLIDDCNYLVTAISGGSPRPKRRRDALADEPDNKRGGMDRQ